MTDDIHSLIRRLLLTAAPLVAVAACGGDGTVGVPDGGRSDGATTACIAKRNLMDPGTEQITHRRSVRVDPSDPRFADLYDDCVQSDRHCAELCDTVWSASGPAVSLIGCHLSCDGSGRPVLDLEGNAGRVTGRRPPGYDVGLPASPGTTVGAFLARSAQLEAASVPAFRLIVEELTAHGAPADLVNRAREAIADERRHARIMRRLAAAHGVTDVDGPAIPRSAPRDLRELARDNATEGCVRETWAAVVAAWQGEHAGDAEIREAMREIALDEARHAQLSWDLDRWLRDRLGPTIARELDRDRRVAVDALLASSRNPVETTLVEQAGLPSGAAEARLLAEAARALWS